MEDSDIEKVSEIVSEAEEDSSESDSVINIAEEEITLGNEGIDE